MTLPIVGLLIEFTVQTVFLLAALWIMIKLQKLDYHFLALLGAAALASGIALVPLPFHLPHIIAYVVLLVCITKVTGAEFIDVRFTVAIAYALMFAMNLWLEGAMMGDLRLSDQAEAKLLTEVKARARTAAGGENTREPLPAAAQPPAAAPAPEQVVPAVKPVKSPTKPMPPLYVKALTRNGAQSAVTLQSGQRSYTLFLGDSEMLQTASGPMAVRFDQLTSQWIVLTVEGQALKLAVP